MDLYNILSSNYTYTFLPTIETCLILLDPPPPPQYVGYLLEKDISYPEFKGLPHSATVGSYILHCDWLNLLLAIIHSELYI